MFYCKRIILNRFLIFLGTFFILNACRGVTFTYTPLLNEAQTHLVSLQLKKARIDISAEQKANPNNIAADYLMGYVEFYDLMIHQKKEDFGKYEILNNQLFDRIKLLPENEAAKLSLLASAHIQNALVKVLFNENLSAAFEFRTAYQYLLENNKKFPGFLGNQKDLGALQALMGTFPDHYKWIAGLVGLSGSFEEGTSKLLNYILHASNEPIIEQQQAAIFYALIQFNFGSDKQIAWNFYQKYSGDYRSNLMQNYIRAFLAGKCGHNDEAIAVLYSKPNSADYEWIPYLDYLMGVCLLNNLDLGAAIWFKKYAAFNQTKGSLRETYQRLSWCSLLQNDSARFRIYHNLMIKNSKNTHGEVTLVEEDLSRGILPNTSLIKARLLFDGGYYQRAEAQIMVLNAFKLAGNFQKIEYYYRLARIAHEQKNYSKAILNYDKTIDMAKDVQTYMAPNSCLQLGLIYQKLNYKQNAKTYLNSVFDYGNYEYKSSIEQKAKAALTQLK